MVINESLLPESIHEHIDSGTRSAHHLRKYLVIQHRYLNNRGAPSIYVGQPQKHAREPLIRSGSQQVCDVILVVLDAGQQIGH
jgi:hypothetical protein